MIEKAGFMSATTGQNDETGARMGAHAAIAEETGDLLGLDLFRDQVVAPPKRQAGRPPGSPNRATTKIKELLLAKGYRDPIEMLAAVVSADTNDLARGLAGEVEAVDVLKLQVRAAEALMPYFHQALPKQVELKGEAPRTLIVFGSEAAEKAVTIQGFSRGEATGSQAQGSHDKGQAVDKTGE